MAGSSIKPGSWGDWAVIEHKPKEQNSCEACIHYCADGSCGIYPIVIKEVGYNYWKKCKAYETESGPSAQRENKSKKQVVHRKYEPKYCPECRSASYNAATKDFHCTNQLSCNYLNRCKQCSYYIPEPEKLQSKLNEAFGKNLFKNSGPSTNIRLCDIHSHIVFDVDDGAVTQERALEMIRHLASKGIKNIVCTSHSWGKIENYYKNFSELRQTINKEKISIHLYKGCEILCDKKNLKEQISKINRGLFASVNRSKYVLIEFEKDALAEDMLYCIQQIKKESGKYCILSQTEHYQNLQTRLSYIKKLKKSGCLFQINLGSLIDSKNEKAMCMARMLLVEKEVDFVGSNTHCREKDILIIQKGIHYILEHCDSVYARRILEKNAKTFLDII